MSRTFDRVLLIRHFAICAGAAAAFVLRTELQIGYAALWIVGASASLNFLAYAFRTRPGLARLCGVASPVIGVSSWAALCAVTNGVGSPFIAGLWLEIVLSAMALARSGVVLVTLGAVAALWGQQLWVGIAGTLVPLALQTGFLVGMGGATYLVTRRWSRTHAQLSRRHADLGDRLEQLERRLEDERPLAEVGSNVARLAHGLKNTVHSLRGFVGLIEPKLQHGGGRAALEGLRAAIDDLEALARLTLDPRRESEAGVCDAIECVGRAVREVTVGHPGVHWTIKSDGAEPTLAMPEPSLREVLVILLRNAAEAMRGTGAGTLETGLSGDVFCIRVSDEGGGLPSAADEVLFRPGMTTKAEGSGYGLFLARRIVEQHGGRLSPIDTATRGAVFEVAVPLAEPR